MAYNKPLGLYTSERQTAYWKIGNTGQETGTRLYASHQAGFLPSSPTLLHPNTHKRNDPKIKLNFSSLPPVILTVPQTFTQEIPLINTANILAFWTGLSQQGQIYCFVFLTSDVTYPQISAAQGVKGGRIAHNGFGVQKQETPPPALSYLWGLGQNLSANHPVLFKCSSPSEG